MHADGSAGNLKVRFQTPNSYVTYVPPPLTWTGWKRLEIDLAARADNFYPPAWDWVIKKACHEGTGLGSLHAPLKTF